jgi:hypothetical protein
MAVVGIVVVLASLAFFLAPVNLWFNSGSRVAGQMFNIPVYRSLGCATVGFGDLYSPNWFGFRFGCNLPFPPIL